MDLKVGLRASDFVQRYGGQPVFVADCTYERGEGEVEE